MALAAKYEKSPSRVFVLLGDGELDEGSVWEAAMFSGHHKLDNLVAIIDRNQCQILGRTSEVLDLEPLADKWRSFGWSVKEIDGHDFEEIFSTLRNIPFEKEKPSCVIANTTKGKGISFMEGELRWHDKCPNEEEYKKAMEELK
jgi:transketolase